jgi:hypothetical protein
MEIMAIYTLVRYSFPDFEPVFPLPVFRTSAHRGFCCAFQWGQCLKTYSRVWVLYMHHQHLAVGRFPVHFRYLLTSEAVSCL